MVVLLDVHVGEFFALDPADSREWMRVVDRPPGDAIDRAGADLVSEARARGWLAGSTGPPAHPGPRSPGNLARRVPVADAYGCLMRAYFAVRYLPFWRSYTWAAAAAPGAHVTAMDRGLATFIRAEHAVVSRLGPDDCLPRSLALYAFLRRCGLPVRHRIGVRRYPFGSHAWVEHGGAPVLDSRDRTDRYTPIATIDGAAGR